MRYTKIAEDSREATWLAEDAPGIRAALFADYTGSSEYIVLELPLPWMYYHVALYKNAGLRVYDFTTGTEMAAPAQVMVNYIWCRTSAVDSLRRANRYNCVPLPNTGVGGYTCAAPNDLPPAFAATQRATVTFALAAFWQQRFHYYEQASVAHELLHEAAGVSSSPRAHIVLEAYEYWAGTAPAALMASPWLNVATATVGVVRDHGGSIRLDMEGTDHVYNDDFDED